MQEQRSPRFVPFTTTGGDPLTNILTVGPGRPVNVWVLSRRICGVLTHFWQGRTVPCTGIDGECSVDHSRTSTRWQGWLAVQKVYQSRVYMVALTEGCLRDCPPLVAADGELRGWHLVLGRRSDCPRSKLVANMGMEGCDFSKLLPEPDVTLFLARLWKIPVANLGGGLPEERQEPNVGFSATMGLKPPQLPPTLGSEVSERAYERGNLLDRFRGKKG